MTKVVKITSFGAQTLQDSTAHKQTRVFDDGGEVQSSLYRTIAGTYFDAFGSTDANVIVPGTTEVELIVIGTTDADFVSKTDAIIALGGTRAVLTGTDANAGTITCNARCRPVERVMQTDTHLGRYAYFTLVFDRIDEWS